jgi:hypothetical protein
MLENLRSMSAVSVYAPTLADALKAGPGTPMQILPQGANPPQGGDAKPGISTVETARLPAQ